MMLHAKYESSSPYGLRQEDFLKKILLYLYVKSENPLHRTNFYSRAVILRHMRYTSIVVLVLLLLLLLLLLLYVFRKDPLMSFSHYFRSRIITCSVHFAAQCSVYMFVLLRIEFFPGSIYLSAFLLHI